MTEHSIYPQESIFRTALIRTSLIPTPLIRALRSAAIHLTLALTCFVTAFPFLWMAVSSLKTKEEVMSAQTLWPAVPQYGNYLSILTDSPIPRYLANSFFVSVSVVLIQLVCCSLFAYAVTFMRAGCRDMLFRLVLFTYMVPTAATYIPCYMILSRMGLLDSYGGLILSNGVSVFGIFLLRQAFKGVPSETMEAARMDGAGHLSILIHVVYPMTRPSFVTFILLSFISTYNSYMWPSLITDTPRFSLVSQGLRTFLYEGGAYGTQWSLVMAAGTVVVAPLLILFAAAWRWIINGITDLGCKG